jgi:hypothetical protein
MAGKGCNVMTDLCPLLDEKKGVGRVMEACEDGISGDPSMLLQCCPKTSTITPHIIGTCSN